MKIKVILVCAVAMGLSTFGAALEPADPRCEYLVNPQGIDTARPRLSWTLQAVDASVRKLGQSGYQILAASSPEALVVDDADLWDSGKILSDETVGIEYAGKALHSRELCYWKVRVWDQKGKASAWSSVSHFSLGLLQRSDWQAQWISAPPVQPVTLPHFGYQSDISEKADTVKWVQIDLGESQPIDGVRLWGTWPAQSWKGDGFPARFKIEVSDDPKFSAVTMLEDCTGQDIRNPGVGPLELKAATPVKGRYVRLTATKLFGEWWQVWNNTTESWDPRPDNRRYKLAFAEIEILSDGKNIARGKTVTAINHPIKPIDGWSADLLTDGRTEGDAGSVYHPRPPPLFRKEFPVSNTIKRATLYSTAMGCYEAYLNGVKVGDHELAPGCMESFRHVLYQTYDATSLVRPGKNAIGVVLADGWYRMRRPFDHLLSKRRFTGYFPGFPSRSFDASRFLGQLEIEYTDGRREVVATDPSWTCNVDGPWRETSIYDGAVYDANYEIEGWAQADLAPSGSWQAPQVHPVTDAGLPAISSQMMEPIREVCELKPVKETEIRPGVYLYDFGDNVAGVCRIRVDGPIGTKISVRHVEVLKPDGSPHFQNLSGNYNNQDVFILSGKGPQMFQAKFTYHSFRYAEVTGARPEAIVAIGLASDLRKITTVESSDPRLNKLCSLVDGAFRDNMFGLVIDVAGRDERMPWMGDCFTTQIQTLSYLYDFAPFGANELQVIIEAASDQGIPPPRLIDQPPGACIPSPCWSDAFITTSHGLWLNQGDRRSLERGYAASKAWMDKVALANPDFVPRKLYVSRFGDWFSARTTIAPDATNWKPTGKGAPNDVFDAAWWAYSARLTSEMAEALGKTTEAAYYREMSKKVLAALVKNHVQPDGTIGNDAQSNYALALGMNHLDGDLREKASARLIESISSYKNHLATGTITTIFLLNVLAESGHQDLAWKLVMQPSAPSFGIMLDYGATSMWERLDEWHPVLGINPNPKAYSHVGFNSVYEWIIGQIAGINPDFSHPAYKHFFIAPKPIQALNRINVSYDSVRGTIKSGYEISGGIMTLQITVPPNTTASLTLPAATLEDVTESGKSILKAPGVSLLNAVTKTVRLQSGNYKFTFPYKRTP
ncbi:MAG: family 78 glycoside hydrolase catalytic domain [Kiritimatiellales bacterium]|nr:family 78 glycoside hydrolase catalytic domain [Kiritimatiellales bacterium]